MPHGVTVTVVLVVFTSFSGEIETAFLGCTRCGPSSAGTAQAATIKEVLDTTLQLSTRKARCRGSRGLPLDAVGPLASVQGHTEVARGNFLCCIPCDRAYCGNIGTKADKILGMSRAGCRRATFCERQPSALSRAMTRVAGSLAQSRSSGGRGGGAGRRAGGRGGGASRSKNLGHV